MSDGQQAPAYSGAMSLEEILDAQGVEYDSVPAWGRHVAIMSITAGEVLDWIEAREDPKKQRDAGLLLIARSLVGPDGRRLCKAPEEMAAIVTSLKDKDSRTCNRIVERIIVLNGITTTAEQAKNVSGAEG